MKIVHCKVIKMEQVDIFFTDMSVETYLRLVHVDVIRNNEILNIFVEDVKVGDSFYGYEDSCNE